MRLWVCVVGRKPSVPPPSLIVVGTWLDPERSMSISLPPNRSAITFTTQFLLYFLVVCNEIFGFYILNMENFSDLNRVSAF